jgi:hypothetical protein
MDGFSLHANTWVAPRDRDRLEGKRPTGLTAAA